MSYSDDKQDQGSVLTIGESSNVNTLQDIDKPNLTVLLTPKLVKITTLLSSSISIYIPEAIKLKGEENWI
jgi:hypothetical protein